MTKVQVAKIMATNAVGEMVDRGMQILKQLTLENLGSTGNPVEVFQQAQENEGSWSADILSFLNGEYFFDDDAIATEYKNLKFGIVPEEVSLERKVSILQESVGQQLSWLEDLILRIDEMSQSELTPTGGAI